MTHFFKSAQQMCGCADFASPPFIRLHETLPTDLGVQLENDPDFDVRVTIPSHFESAVGNDRAELLDPDIWHELLVCMVFILCMQLETCGCVHFVLEMCSFCVGTMLVLYW